MRQSGLGFRLDESQPLRVYAGARRFREAMRRAAKT
jgi:hypothetical protein